MRLRQTTKSCAEPMRNYARVYNKQGSAQWMRVPHPYHLGHAPCCSLRRLDIVLPTTSLGPKVTFTSVEDPEAHLTAFHTQMMLTGGFDVVYCKLLMSTLAGTSLEWFVSLPDGHITTFDQFATLFREQYLINRAPPESLTMSLT